MASIQTVALLLADLSGSTALYRRLGDVAAQRLVAEEIEGLRRITDRSGGRFVSQKGDDMLATFERPADAFFVAQAMVNGQSVGDLRVHVGVHFGQIVETDGDIFGDAVNLTARLAALATLGEACLSEAIVAQLDPGARQSLQQLGSFRFKGIEVPTTVFALHGQETGLMTRHRPVEVEEEPTSAAGARLHARLYHGDSSLDCTEGSSLLIGRSRECDIVMTKPWISRAHATVSLRAGRLVLEDRSTLGTYVSTASGPETRVHRETLSLPWSGWISPAASASSEGSEVIRFEIIEE